MQKKVVKSLSTGNNNKTIKLSSHSGVNSVHCQSELTHVIRCFTNRLNNHLAGTDENQTVQLEKQVIPST